MKNFLIIASSLLVLSSIAAAILWLSLFPQQPAPIAVSEKVDSTSAAPSPSPLLPSPLPTLPTAPMRKVLPGGRQVFQTFNNCGPAALSMALSHYGVEISQQELGRQLRPYQHPTGDNDDKSVTLAEIAAKADDFSLRAYYRPAGTPELIKQLVAQDLPVLTRTWLKVNEDIGHFRVIKGYDDTTGQFLQDDSLQGGNLWYTYDDFDQLWRAFNYEFVVLVPEEKISTVEQILGDLADESGAWSRALELADQQLIASSDDVYARFNRSVALYHLDRYEEAVAEFKRVESRLPNRMLWYQIEPILAYYQLGQTDRVMELSDQILTRHNRAFSELYYLRGLIHQQRGEQDLARDNFTKADFYNLTGSWKSNLPAEIVL